MREADGRRTEVAFRGDKAQTFRAGDVVFRDGDPALCLYVVRSGAVELRAGGQVLETVQAGGLFGEMALFDGAPRSATAVAVSDSELVPIDERRFLFLVQETPFFAQTVMRTMAARLRRMTSALAESAV
jgi:CRP/FNR family transcriptional regulator, cyclic AMP receptor protein